MQNRFIESMEKLGFPVDGRPILVAVSAGVDSIVLASLLHDSGYSLHVAHCNYQLRASDSDADESFVQSWCEERNIPFHLKRVQTQKLVQQSNASVQMVARVERYSFFHELLEKYDFRAVALAHHANDRVESLLLNLLRGTGFRGFQGMPSKRDKIIRPLIEFRKEEIRQYAEENGVSFREDHSNQETRYQRNWVRLMLLPMLHAYDSDTFKKLLNLSVRAESEFPNYEKWMDNETSRIKTDNQISIGPLLRSSAPFTVLKEILEPLGYNSDLIFEVMEILDSTSGAKVESESHRVTKDRSELIISPRDRTDGEPKLRFQFISINQLTSLKTEPNVALIDAGKVKESQIKVRKWKNGDRFKPLGMDRWKLLSDFFIDQKLSIPEKEKVCLMTHEDEIVWVIGHRIDNRFKISDNTQKVLKITVDM
jgi:tRNA(Ile)-lysidine synthase